MSDSEDSTTLFRAGPYRVVQRFDMALLTWPGGELIVGDHSLTDPQCAAINAARRWCVSGGQGLEICHFDDGLPQGPDAPAADRVKLLSLWRHENPPPDGQRYWFVARVWLERDDLVRVLVNPSPGDVGVYEVDVRSLHWTALWRCAIEAP